MSMFKITIALRLLKLKIVYSCLDLNVISFVLVPEASAPYQFSFRGVLLYYRLVMNLLLRKVSNRHILTTRAPKDKLFAVVVVIEESWKSFKSWTYLVSHLFSSSFIRLSAIGRSEIHQGTGASFKF